ncbi:hypothetical protein E3N88_15014 [Mikania micrantha]|uniref:Uncharacterized protein n=1 Tax=Mikania micrantha TaxID=192012 RepID=A0A5N6P323_9ASTR|nr:hypothetical protein E3N88_15014 [Mikania micrantha]
MWWDGVWAGCRLDSGVCPIHKHTELDDTGVVNEVKVLPKEVTHRNRLKLLDCILGCQLTDLVDFGEAHVLLWKLYTFDILYSYKI